MEIRLPYSKEGPNYNEMHLSINIFHSAQSIDCNIQQPVACLDDLQPSWFITAVNADVIYMVQHNAMDR